MNCETSKGLSFSSLFQIFFGCCNYNIFNVFLHYHHLKHKKIQNNNRVYPCSTMFTFIFSVWCSSIDAKQSCFKNLQNICRVVCWTTMCFGFWKSDKFAQQLQGSLLDTLKLRLLGSLANLPSMGMSECLDSVQVLSCPGPGMFLG